jgi:phage terminase Nu1 subunit (DNA packaging protein)
MSKVTDPKLVFTRAQLAELAGVTTKTLQRWEEGGLSAARLNGGGQRVRYDGPASFQYCVQTEARRLAQVDASAAAPDDETGEAVVKSSWDARYARARALAAEIELEADRGTLVPAAELHDVLARASALARSLPRREAPAVARLLGVEPRDAMPLLERVSDQILALFHEALEGRTP